MTNRKTLFILEDEPLILMDLEFAAEDAGCKVLTAISLEAGIELVRASVDTIDVAILDVSLGHGKTCLPVAQRLKEMGVPFILHSGDLDRHDEHIRKLDAHLVAKPAPVERVISTALERVAA